MFLDQGRTVFKALQECRRSPNFKTVYQIHGRITKLGYGIYSSIISSLISSYLCCDQSKLASQLLNEFPHQRFDLVSSNMLISNFMTIRDVDTANRLFNNMAIRDTVSWNSMIGGFVKIARYNEAIQVFFHMLSSNVNPDGYTFASSITACARIGALDHGERIHGIFIEKKIDLNHILSSALIDMYSKCGRIHVAKEVFDNSLKNDVSVWNAMITAYATHGLGYEAIGVFSRMEIEPDSITFIGVLTACSHSGLVEEGREYFATMNCSYSIEPSIHHYGAMVDLLGRAGFIDEAYGMIQRMPMKPDSVIWRALLSACTNYKNTELGEIAVSKISDLDSGDYVLLANIYCGIRKWEGAEKLRNTMKRNGVRKVRGKSWIEIGSFIHQFKAGDRIDRDTEKVLGGLIKRMKMEGFVASSEMVLMDVCDEEKEENLNMHSEKLALAFGIMKTSPGSEIMISKNIRTCLDCHRWMKMISAVLNRTVIVRDRVRFHRFESGVCSCGDYW
ncbi:pentatricopeptide repeat-containing protein At5g50990 [Impatiens glandulifera]|uniref:pentatricopeptide repeat-containing protein At5g50990 n=1 Tax=Impatiens glandulifera TaxID=253017 RepID=UPI001FB0CF9E|nr:pentatricopeptide repeat-containing protein At5g50990 [Impatiens glandulifera]